MKATFSLSLSSSLCFSFVDYLEGCLSVLLETFRSRNKARAQYVIAISIMTRSQTETTPSNIRGAIDKYPKRRYIAVVVDKFRLSYGRTNVQTSFHYRTQCSTCATFLPFSLFLIVFLSLSPLLSLLSAHLRYIFLFISFRKISQREKRNFTNENFTNLEHESDFDFRGMKMT